MTYFKNENHTSGGEEVRGPLWEGGKDLANSTIGDSLFWDVEHSCRALEPIEAWVAEHQGH